MPRTLFEKIWSEHLVEDESAATPAILYVDLHLVHEVTSPQAFDVLRERGLKVRRPDRTIATEDHSTPTTPRTSGPFVYAHKQGEEQVRTLERNCAEFGVELFPLGSDGQGIVHVIGPELGLTQPGSTVVCGDSHTSTHGAFGALAFGIGTSEVGYVLATQCLLQRRPKTMEVRIEGSLPQGVSAKDLILAIVARIGVGGGRGHVLEYTGAAVRALSMEGRMTICNMSIEAGARAGMVAPDETTFEYLAGRPRAPKREAFDRAVRHWRTLPGDPGAAYDNSVTLNASSLAPMITWGTHPGSGVGVTESVPAPADAAAEKSLRYMGLKPGQKLIGHPVDVVFIGSCTNSRIEDLRSAASVLRGQKVSRNVRTLIVPGSVRVKQQAESEGLHHIFRDAGAEWREPGCSMCLSMNGDAVGPGKTAVSTSNRNFEGRQGKDARTMLASPLTAAATAIKGSIADPREMLR
jgi:3-isopropylmalate/(R)-2-methylmalate dehydratase large subunit